MNKEDYIKLAEKKLSGKALTLMKEQISKYYTYKDVVIEKHNYKKGNTVSLKKGTLLHGTYQNINGLENMLNQV